MNRCYILLMTLVCALLVCGCVSDSPGNTAVIDSNTSGISDLEERYDDLEQRYNVLNEKYVELQGMYEAASGYEPWQSHISYYRAYFGDDDYYIWLYSSYDNLVYWKTIAHPRATDVITTDLLNNYIVYSGDRTLVDTIASAMSSEGISDKEFAEMALSYVHDAIYYMSDSESVGENEYWKYPDETLFDKVGDCEDTSFPSLGHGAYLQFS